MDADAGPIRAAAGVNLEVLTTINTPMMINDQLNTLLGGDTPPPPPGSPAAQLAASKDYSLGPTIQQTGFIKSEPTKQSGSQSGGATLCGKITGPAEFVNPDGSKIVAETDGSVVYYDCQNNTRVIREPTVVPPKTFDNCKDATLNGTYTITVPPGTNMTLQCPPRGVGEIEFSDYGKQTVAKGRGIAVYLEYTVNGRVQREYLKGNFNKIVDPGTLIQLVGRDGKVIAKATAPGKKGAKNGD